MRWIYLVIITVVATILRMLPGLINAAWGCDFGIYFGLAKSLVENKELFNPYEGWGTSYQYFPILFALTGIAHWITGIDVLTIMPKVIPIFGGLSVLIFYFVAFSITGDKKKALISSLLLGVLPFHAYQTSHASPLTMGHFFLMLSLYLFIKFRQNTKYILPLLFSTSLLIMSHHFTTYIYIISLAFIIFAENSNGLRESLKKDVPYFLVASGLTFSYWATVATPVYYTFMRRGFGLIEVNPNLIIVLFYASFFLVLILKRKYCLKRKVGFSTSQGPSPISSLYKLFLTIGICLCAMIFFSVFKLPWTNFTFTPASILYSIPLLLIIGFGVAGFGYAHHSFVKGWLLALFLSFIYGLVTNSVILPHRHLEYMMAPLSILSIYGIEGIFFHGDRSFLRLKIFRKKQLIYIGVILTLVTANAASVYPSHIALNASYEAITYENLAVIEWMEENLDKNTTVVASDHRLARIAEAVGFNSTLDEASEIWVAENLSGCIKELKGIGKNYGRITHILIDDIMKEKVVHVGFAKIFYMTNESYEKFLHQPFELLYRNVTIDEEMNLVHWAEVYKVNWTYLER